MRRADSHSELPLVRAELPPLALLSVRQDAEDIDWECQHVVSPEHIMRIRTIIETSYPRRRSTWGPSSYPENHLNPFAISLNRNNNDIIELYNPFHLILPSGIASVGGFINWDCISESPYLSPNQIRKETASEKYLNFLREYHLLYVDILEAMNGSVEAKKRIGSKIDTQEMYANAEVDSKMLNYQAQPSTASLDFRRSLLAYLTLDTLRSTDEAISTAARVRALDLLYSFKIDSVVQAFCQNMSALSCL